MNEYMNTEGWIFLFFGWGFVLTLTIYCFYKVFSTGTKLKKDKRLNKKKIEAGQKS